MPILLELTPRRSLLAFRTSTSHQHQCQCDWCQLEQQDHHQYESPILQQFQVLLHPCGSDFCRTFVFCHVYYAIDKKRTVCDDTARLETTLEHGQPIGGRAGHSGQIAAATIYLEKRVQNSCF
jgi:hypothetical protein